MKRYRVCILDKDIQYVKAFMKTVALDHPGVDVGTRGSCGESCAKEIDVCLGFGVNGAARASCEKAFEPLCGKYAGVAVILSESRKFLLDRAAICGNGTALYDGKMRQACSASFEKETLICVYAFSGGLGTSCAAIGIGRELARYRGERVLYLSLEDIENESLFPVGLAALCAEEVLYRYLRLQNKNVGPDGYEQLFHTAAACDEYGLYRFSPDEGANSIASITSGELYIFIAYATIALKLDRVVLDFGTRLHFLSSFAALLEDEEAYFIEACAEENNGERGKRFPVSGGHLLTISFPFCDEDVKPRDGHTDVGIANSFGLAVKETCDRITGDMI